MTVNQQVLQENRCCRLYKVAKSVKSVPLLFVIMVAFLLGTGGLVRAYGNGVQQALKLLETERKVERQLFQVHCDYAQLNWIQILCEQHQIEIYQQDFQVQITLQLGISEDQIKPFEQALIEHSAGTLKLEK